MIHHHIGAGKNRHTRIIKFFKMIPVRFVCRFKEFIICHLFLHDRITDRCIAILLDIFLAQFIEISICHDSRCPGNTFFCHLLCMIQRHKGSMFDRVKSGINTHLDPRIGSGMHATLDSSSVAFIHRRIQFFLGKLRIRFAVGGQDLHPFRTIANLLTDFFTDCPRTVRFLDFIPGMSARHADSGIRMHDSRDHDKSLLFCQFQILAYAMC